MTSVLLLGNGISRLLHEPFIDSWSGELWGANYIYTEWGGHLTRLTGHANVLAEAAEYRATHGLSFLIMGRIGNEESAEVPITCPGEFRKDSGTVMVAQAHEEGFERIYVCGFDLGGADILSPDLYLQAKAQWVRRWRQIFKRYGSERVEFLGHDHKPFLLSDKLDDTYQRRYRRGLPHVPDPDYITLHRLIYGPTVWGYRSDRTVRVRWLVKRPGWETDYKEEVALKLAEKGKVEIIGTVREANTKAADDALNAETKVTARMSAATIRKIAKLRGIEDADDHTRADLLEMLKG